MAEIVDTKSALTALVRGTAPLAQGGFSEVFVWEDKAVKVGLGEKEHHSALLVQEAAYLEQLAAAGCRAVVGYHGMHKLDLGPTGRVALVLDRMDCDLAQVISARKLADAELAWVARGVGSALSHFEALRLTHGDIKPGNILLKGEAVKLADFGSSSADAARPQSFTTGYQAPEYLIGAKRAPRCSDPDMWCLGVTLLEAALQKNPFDLPSTKALFTVISTALPPFPHPLEGVDEAVTEHLHALGAAPPSVAAERAVIEGSPLLSALLQLTPARRPSPAEFLALPAVAEAAPVALAGPASDDAPPRRV
eukprot:TRINITY_DN25148_c0_g1_i1.p1 TRINITY_DN25148_c0_g1~~TRINITY_DN25148_c0_g1_i1.p1  ORF type:complete len:308 (+),score=102.77 TRINITY_DN25148_c0_g1_i1:57-980(+)